VARRPAKPTPPPLPLSPEEAGVLRVIHMHGRGGPDGTIEGDAWAMLGARVLFVEPVEKGNFWKRHEALVAWLTEYERTEGPADPRHTQLLLPAQEARRDVARVVWKALLPEPSPRLMAPVPLKKFPPRLRQPEGRPLTRVAGRVRRALEDSHLLTPDQQTALLKLLSLTRSGPGRGHRSRSR